MLLVIRVVFETDEKQFVGLTCSYQAALAMYGALRTDYDLGKELWDLDGEPTLLRQC